MALIRQVRQNPTTKKWAYIEGSDENSSHCIILGDMEFDTEQEADAHSEGFEHFSYTYSDPVLTKLVKLNNEKTKLLKRLAEIDNEIANS